MAIQSRLVSIYPNAKYSFDTNVYITIWRDYYPPDRFKKLYNDLEDLINRGIILSTFPVKIELKKQRDKIFDFFNRFQKLFIEPQKEEQGIVERLVNHPDLPNWGAGDSEKHYADPYIVALAKVYNLKVVTYESGRGHNKICRACEVLNVECWKFIDFLREEDLIY
ncbi:MAG: DUF4411 family protein [Promethearchaeota archaeon]|nr:MAG: DUF4411 family protein [Candidatus Lokiarchaeota archaeon]